jgi:hypothetical protein
MIIVISTSCTPTANNQTSPLPEKLAFAKAPYMGVACPEPNSTVCDRIGLALWLKEKPVEVIAIINDRRIYLALPRGHGNDSRGEYVEGYVQPAGLHALPFGLPDVWMGEPPASVPVMIEVEFKAGRKSSTTVEIGLHAGWG